VTTYSIASGGTIAVPSSLTIRAVATAPGYTPSAEADAAYTISASSTLPYPISASILLDSPAGYITSTAGQQAQARYYNYVCLNGNGYQGGTNFAAAFAAIKGYAAAGHTVYTGFYTLADSWYQNAAGAISQGNADVWKANGMSGSLAGMTGPFSLYAGSYGSGGPAATGNGNPAQYGANYTDACPKYNITAVGSVTGPGTVNWSEFAAWGSWQSLANGNLAAMGNNGTPAFPANSHCDFWYQDNLVMFPITGGSYFNNSTIYSSSSADATLRASTEQGWIDSWNMIQSLQPTQVSGGPALVGGNFRMYGYPGNPTPVIDQTNVCQIAGFENGIGFQAPFTTFAGFLKEMMLYEEYTGRPDLCWFNIECGNPSNGALNQTYLPGAQSGWSAQNWRSVRYQIGIALLMRWVAAFQNNHGSYTWAFDELDAGTNSAGYLGAPTGTRPVNASTGAYVPPNSTAASAYSIYGIITILFQNGVGYLYPAATGDTQSGSNITLTSAYLQGGGGTTLTYTVEGSNGPPSIPSNTAVTSITIQPRDFVILLS
jgi:hypothetical protein